MSVLWQWRKKKRLSSFCLCYHPVLQMHWTSSLCVLVCRLQPFMRPLLVIGFHSRCTRWLMPLFMIEWSLKSTDRHPAAFLTSTTAHTLVIRNTSPPCSRRLVFCGSGVERKSSDCAIHTCKRNQKSSRSSNPLGTHIAAAQFRWVILFKGLIAVEKIFACKCKETFSSSNPPKYIYTQSKFPLRRQKASATINFCGASALCVRRLNWKYILCHGPTNATQLTLFAP